MQDEIEAAQVMEAATGRALRLWGCCQANPKAHSSMCKTPPAMLSVVRSLWCCCHGTCLPPCRPTTPATSTTISVMPTMYTHTPVLSLLLRCQPHVRLVVLLLVSWRSCRHEQQQNTHNWNGTTLTAFRVMLDLGSQLGPGLPCTDTHTGRSLAGHKKCLI